MIEDAVRARNLGTLRQFQPALHQELIKRKKKTNVQPPALTIQDGRRGYPTLRAQDDEGDYYFHSLYDPISEAKQFIEAEINIGKLASGELNVVFVLGFGLGYLPEQLLELMPANSSLIVIEQDLASLDLALTARDMSNWIADKRLRWILEPNPAKAAMLCVGELPLHRVQGWKVLLPTPQVRRQPAYAKTLFSTLSGDMNRAFTAVSTDLVRGPLIMSNELSNLLQAAAAPGLKSVHGRWQGKPLILVAAGPSLDKQLPMLAEIQDRFLIVAASQALPALRNFNVRPHIVVAIDYSISVVDFEGDAPGKITSESRFFDLLAVDLACSPELLPIAEGRLIVGHATEQMENLFKGIYGPKGVWNAGGSVATAAMVLANLLKADPIILVGQDLALTGGQSHGRHYRHKATTVEELTQQDPNALSTVPGYYGEPVTTRRDYRAYLSWFEEFIQHNSKMVVINATEGGARISGAKQMPLKEAAELYRHTEKISHDAIAAWGIGEERGINYVGLAKEIKRMVSAAEEIARKCTKGLTSLEAWRREVDNSQDLSARNSLEAARAQYEAIVQYDSPVKFVIESMNRHEILFANRALDEVRSDPRSPVKADIFQFIFLSFKDSASNVAETFAELGRRLEERGHDET